MPYFPPSSGGGGGPATVAIGSPITGGAAGGVLYESGAGNIAQSTALVFDETDVQLALGAGSAAKPSLSIFDDGMGLYRAAADTLGLVTAGVERWRVSSAGVLQPKLDGTYDIGAAGGLRPRDVFLQSRILSGAGSAANPAHGFDADPDTGLYNAAANQLGLATAGVGRWFIDASGNLLAVTDNTFNFGAIGATRPKSLFVGTSINIGARGAIVDSSTPFTAGQYGSQGTSGVELLGRRTAADTASGPDVFANTANARTAGFTFGAYNNAVRKFGVKFDGRAFVGTPNSAPTDADLQASEITWYLDEAGNNMKIRVKYADGTTLKTATVALV